MRRSILALASVAGALAVAGLRRRGRWQRCRATVRIGRSIHGLTGPATVGVGATRLRLGPR